MFGPLCTVYENLLSMGSTVAVDGVVQLEASSVHNFSECIKHALLLLGDVAARMSTNCRELVPAKINPLMVSLAQQEFSDTKQDLFGSGFEQRLKSRSETAETISKAAQVSKPFFRGGASRGIHRPHGGQQGFNFKTFRPPDNPRGNVYPTRGAYRGRSRAQSPLEIWDLRFCTFLPKGVSFFLPGLTKTSKPGDLPKTSFHTAFREDKDLCPVECLRVYLDRSKEFRTKSKDKQDKLFLSFIILHQPVTSATFSRNRHLNFFCTLPSRSFHHQSA